MFDKTTLDVPVKKKKNDKGQEGEGERLEFRDLARDATRARTKGAADIKPRGETKARLSISRWGSGERRAGSLGRGLSGPTSRGITRMGWLTEHGAD